MPLRFDLSRSVQQGVDDDDNPVFTPTTPIEGRKCRRYRDRALESAYVRDGRNVSGVVACRYRRGDVIVENDELLVYGLDRNGNRVGEVRLYVVHPKAMMGIRIQSHWEIVIAEVGR